MQPNICAMNAQDTIDRNEKSLFSTQSNHVDCLRIRAEDDSIVGKKKKKKKAAGFVYTLVTELSA